MLLKGRLGAPWLGSPGKSVCLRHRFRSPQAIPGLLERVQGRRVRPAEAMQVPVRFVHLQGGCPNGLQFSLVIFKPRVNPCVHRVAGYEDGDCDRREYRRKPGVVEQENESDEFHQRERRCTNESGEESVRPKGGHHPTMPASWPGRKSAAAHRPLLG